jgi:hypothetical protein
MIFNIFRRFTPNSRPKEKSRDSTDPNVTVAVDASSNGSEHFCYSSPTTTVAQYEKQNQVDKRSTQHSQKHAAGSVIMTSSPCATAIQKAQGTKQKFMTFLKNRSMMHGRLLETSKEIDSPMITTFMLTAAFMDGRCKKTQDAKLCTYKELKKFVEFGWQHHEEGKEHLLKHLDKKALSKIGFNSESRHVTFKFSTTALVMKMQNPPDSTDVMNTQKIKYSTS